MHLLIDFQHLRQALIIGRQAVTFDDDEIWSIFNASLKKREVVSADDELYEPATLDFDELYFMFNTLKNKNGCRARKDRALHLLVCGSGGVWCHTEPMFFSNNKETLEIWPLLCCYTTIIGKDYKIGGSLPTHILEISPNRYPARNQGHFIPYKLLRR